METKLYDKNCITLDGRLDEPVWKTAQAYTGFKYLKDGGGSPAPVETTFHVLPCEDRIFVGIKCNEPDIERVVAGAAARFRWQSDSVELFLAPTGDPYEFYQFFVSVTGQSFCIFHSEGGNIRPDPYEPLWNCATYAGEDYWSVEIEIPLTAFYMTPNSKWSSRWLLNLSRTRTDYNAGGASKFYTWGDLQRSFCEPTNFPSLEGFPMRPEKNDVRIASAAVEINNKTEKGFVGNLVVNAIVPFDGEYTFSSECAETVDVALKAGSNEISVPCCFEKDKQQKIDLQLVRKSDGEVFKRWYPVRVDYEPIKLALTLPEFRGNFYPGQDYSKVVGKVIANKPVTVTLEGPGIGIKTATLDVDGNFTIDTTDMEIGNAMLTITDGVNTVTKKIRRLAPTGRMMSWISGGNLIVNGKPTLRRDFLGVYYRGCEAFNARYDADNLHQTRDVCASTGAISPGRLMPGADTPGGEATFDQKPSDEMYKRASRVIEANRNNDFAYYYIDDEPECRGVSPVYLKYLYDYITDQDPYHVILLSSRNANSFVECTDWVETHPYLGVMVRDGKRTYERSINTVGRFVDRFLNLNRSDKCIGFMPTCFAYKFQSMYADYPTFDEMICHVWAAILAGAKTLWACAYHDLDDRACLYEGIRYVYSTFEVLEDMILLGKRTELVRNAQVHAVHYELNGEKMFAVANMAEEPQTVTLDGISGTWYNFRHGGTITGNTFELKPHEVLVGTSKVRDTGLPTYQEAAELIDKLEYERTHSGSVFFDRQNDMIINGGPGNVRYKVFDGILDNCAWECIKVGKYFEMDITKFRPTFSKLVIHGFRFDGLEMKVRNNGEISVPAVKEVKNEKFSRTYIFETPISPDCVIIEFADDKGELYEIEAF